MGMAPHRHIGRIEMLKSKVWSAEREQGLVWFCIKKGVLLWGLLLFCSVFLGRHIVDIVLYEVDWSRLVSDLKLGLPLCSVLGFTFGYLLWKKNEKDFSKS